VRKVDAEPILKSIQH